jgi:hypothetical protein
VNCSRLRKNVKIESNTRIYRLVFCWRIENLSACDMSTRRIVLSRNAMFLHCVFGLHFITPDPSNVLVENEAIEDYTIVEA